MHNLVYHQALTDNGDSPQIWPIPTEISNSLPKKKNIGCSQRGGTATIIAKILSSFVKDSGTDHSGPGQWLWYLIEGSLVDCTRLITAYAPCGNSNSGDQKVFQKHIHYIQRKKLQTNPTTMFREDLLNILRVWRMNGDRVILTMNANECVLGEKLCKQQQKRRPKYARGGAQEYELQSPKHIVPGIRSN